MREITGRKVFAFTAGAFGVIIGVNLLMATLAVSTFPGLEVKNSYVASQSFEADRAAQEALGWRAEVDYDGARLVLSITDREGQPVPLASIAATIGRRTTAAQDMTPDFHAGPEGYAAEIDLAPGGWRLHLEARAADGSLFRQRIDLQVKG